MGISAWIDLIIAALKFPSAVTALINTLKSTPAEQHEALVKAIQAEAQNMKATGRPTW